VARLQGNAVASTTLIAGDAGKSYVWNGTSLTAKYFGIGDLKNAAGTSYYPQCSSSQTLTWVSATDTLTCSNIAIGDSAVTYASQTQNRVFASPDGASGAPTYRALVAGDIPGLDWSKITSGKPTTISGFGITDSLIYNGGQNGAVSLGSNDANSVTLKANNSAAMTILPSGNVGIGTASPAYDLHILTTGQADLVLGTNSTANSVMAFHTDFDGTSRMGSIGFDYNDNVLKVLSGPSFENSSNGIMINPSGNVGIGTTTPGQKLSVTGTIESTTGGIKFPDGTTQLTAATGGGSGGSFAWVQFDGATCGATCTILSSSNVSSVTRNAAGDYTVTMISGVGSTNYGILSSGSQSGTTSVNDRFPSVYPISSTQFRIIFSAWTNGNSLNDAKVITASVLSGNTSPVISQWTTAASNVYFNTGNVGIGTTSPGYTLHVVGTAGLSTGTTWTNASDLRLKDIHGDYEYGLEEVLKLHTVRYNYKKDNPLGLPADFDKTGFIAQEVQKVIPDAVKERKDGYLELNVDPIHWAVVNAVKELFHRWFDDSKDLHSKIAALEAKAAEVDTLRLENAALKEKVQSHEMMRAYLCQTDPDAPFCR